MGIVPIKEALKMAENEGLDLVKVTNDVCPPVCKIMNYGKYKFALSKREREAKKNQRVIGVKEIRLSVNIGAHDFETKVNSAKKFAFNGDKIKVIIRFKGREAGHSNIGLDLMKRFAQACQEFSNVESAAKVEGRNMLMFLTPNLKEQKTLNKIPKERCDVGEGK